MSASDQHRMPDGEQMKLVSKRLADATATLLVSPAFLAYMLSRLVLGREKAFPGWSQLFLRR